MLIESVMADPACELSAALDIAESPMIGRDAGEFMGKQTGVSITANLAPDYSLGEALKFMDATAAKVLKPGYTTELNGTSREFKNSQGALVVVFVLALLFIFLVLSAQFESFIDPFVIMLSVPLSMIGALLALKFTGGSLNVYSQIGNVHTGKCEVQQGRAFSSRNGWRCPWNGEFQI
jgi:multidrug efflux pump